MRSVVQRVRSARVEVRGEVVGSIDAGLLVYAGSMVGDALADVRQMAGKIAHLRIFEDDAGKMGRSVLDTTKSVLVVSQFTLFGDVRRGRRPSFERAERPELAEPLYDQFCAELRALGCHVQTGRFRADMQVFAQVDGPVTLLLDSRDER